MVLIICEDSLSPQVNENITESFTAKMITLEASKGTVHLLLMGLVVCKRIQ